LTKAARRVLLRRVPAEGRDWGEGEGKATDGYALVAAANPYGLTAMRRRGVKYWWAGLGLLVLALMYVAPVAAVFRQPAFTAAPTPLPNIAFPNFGVPLLRVPKLHAAPPMPAPLRVHHASAPAAQHVVRKVVRHTVPVISDLVTGPDGPKSGRAFESRRRTRSARAGRYREGLISASPRLSASRAD